MKHNIVFTVAIAGLIFAGFLTPSGAKDSWGYITAIYGLTVVVLVWVDRECSVKERLVGMMIWAVSIMWIARMYVFEKARADMLYVQLIQNSNEARDLGPMKEGRQGQTAEGENAGGRAKESVPKKTTGTQPSIVERRVAELDRRVHLTAEQRTKVQALFQKEADQQKALPASERKEKARGIAQAAHMELHTILTKEQGDLLHPGVVHK